MYLFPPAVNVPGKKRRWILGMKSRLTFVVIWSLIHQPSKIWLYQRADDMDYFIIALHMCLSVDQAT